MSKEGKEKFPLKMGFNTNIGDDHYHSNREFISSSGLKLLAESANQFNPRKFHKSYVLDIKDDKSQSFFDFGQYVHALVLEPHTVKDRFAIFEGAMRRGKAWETFKEENDGNRIIMTASQFNLAKEMMRNYTESKAIIGAHGYEDEVPLSSFFKKGKAEESLCVEINGVKVKVRFDYRRETKNWASIQDVKTTGELLGTKSAVEEVCDRYDYDLSAALYVDAAMQETAIPHDFYFLFMSKTGSKDVKMFKASEEMLERGRQKYLEGIEALKIARESGIYYHNRIEELG